MFDKQVRGRHGRAVSKLLFLSNILMYFHIETLYVNTLVSMSCYSQDHAHAAHVRVRRLNSVMCFHIEVCSVRLSVRTLPFQGGKTSSILVPSTKELMETWQSG